MRSPEVLVIGYKGCPNFVARVIPGLPGVVATEDGDLHVVPVACISDPQAVRYARHWAVQTGRSIADVYIPGALR